MKKIKWDYSNDGNFYRQVPVGIQDIEILYNGIKIPIANIHGIMNILEMIPTTIAFEAVINLIDGDPL